MFKQKGFTLIELLVVVLIIGILAAIAIPQYQKAVSKAELQESLLQLRALVQAEEEYKLVHGTWTTNLDALSLNFPDNKWACGGSFCHYLSGRGFYLELVLSDNTYYCIAFNNKAKDLCVDIGGEFYYDAPKYGSTYYKINPF